MTSWSRAAAGAAAAGLALAAAACGTDAAAPAPAPDGPRAVQLWSVPSPVGTVVIDAAGQVLYRFDADSPDPSTTTCVDACTQTWRPLLTGGQPVRALGVAEDRIGTLTRPDGAEQVTFHGWPLYTRAGDPGGLYNTGPNGTDGKWFAITPSGDRATPGGLPTPGPTPAPTPAPGG
jgi:predicted lipoprotein with Yx(FWY)xxD motif